MHTAYSHLIINYISIAGCVFATLILLAGFITQKTQVKLTALGVLICSAITSVIAYYSGEAAEETVSFVNGVSETLIHWHAQYALTYFILSILSGALSLVTFMAEAKKLKVVKYLFILCLLLSIATGAQGLITGKSGIEMRQTGIRNNTIIIPPGDSN